MAGDFVWFDLSATDIPSAIRFYTELTGWSTEKFEMGGGMPYRCSRAATRPSAA